MKDKILVGLIIAFFSIGLVSMITYLVIDTQEGVGQEDPTVVFSEIILDGIKSNSLISQDGQSLTINIAKISSENNRHIIEYTLVNKSQSVSFNVDIICTDSHQTADIGEKNIIANPQKLHMMAQEERQGTISILRESLESAEQPEEFTCRLSRNRASSEDDSSYLADNSCQSVAAPNLGTDDNLIPIIINDDGVVTKVSKENPAWYDYCNKQWANAVILNDNVQNYEDDQTINESDIEAYFVWIPKYKYRLWNVNGEDSLANIHAIDIIFDKDNTQDSEGISCKTPMLSGNTGKCDNGEYMTHPAFISFDVKGFWVGKFETGYRNDTDENSVQISSPNPDDIIIKPNVYSWRNNAIKNMFEAAMSYEQHLNSHMMKNTEWGAVAYLSHSKYGINQALMVNNQRDFKTGYASLTHNSDSPVLWNTPRGVLASTTGNITGIFDMAGGAFEYMAAYIQNHLSDSGFKDEMIAYYDKKFFDLYDKSSTINSYQNMILGDATGELGPFSLADNSLNNKSWHSSWYEEISQFITSDEPWLKRSGLASAENTTGIFGFASGTGASAMTSTFRLVLAP